MPATILMRRGRRNDERRSGRSMGNVYWGNVADSVHGIYRLRSGQEVKRGQVWSGHIIFGIGARSTGFYYKNNSG